MTLWRDAGPVDASALASLELHPLISQTLIRRGVASPEAARAFLAEDAYTPAPPSALPDLEAALERLTRAIRAGERICVWGDFDVDGQTSTALLVQALSALGANVTYYIPVRARESHGVHLPKLAELIDNGAQLILTCDTGITAHQAVDYARGRGVDFVITDHHDLAENLPNAAACVNPKRLPGEHPLATLAGVGVAYKLAEALLAEFQPEALEAASLADLAALGLVADLALLRRDTRNLVQKGLKELRQARRAGLQAIYELASLNPANLTEEHIGFVLAPRLNALGRLGDANPAVELLTTRDPVRARVLAAQLEGLNAQRKLLCDQVTQAAEAQLQTNKELLTQPILILHHPEWPGGVIGIAASRLVERYRKPAILLTGKPEDNLRGSARSVNGLHITQAIQANNDLLLGFGGHPMAAGLSLPGHNLEAFRRRMGKTVESMLGTVEEPALQIDAWLELDQANLALAEQLETLAPFGPGNEKLTLAARSLEIESARKLGRNQEHLKLSLRDQAGTTRDVLWWDGASEDLPEGRFDLAFTLRASDWRGVRQAQMEFVAFRRIEDKPVEVRRKTARVEDLRRAEKPLELLTALQARETPVVWAEGAEKLAIPSARYRHELHPATTLIIWTTPPDALVIQQALETVRPQTILVFARDPQDGEPQAFLNRLAGVVKTILNKRAGQTSLEELAAACAQSETAVRLGLEWLAKRGQVRAESDPRGNIRLAACQAGADEPGSRAIQSHLQTILAETAAFRAYFGRAEASALLGLREVK